ncbi:MAG: proton-conducting transporter membrane subunit [Acidimicrobiia bacterium]|nr:proton-conducting transporter membrane subunit [Acidimicrobiia bacterium]
MIWVFLLLHLVGLAASAAAGWRWGIRAGLAVASFAPAVTGVWAIEELILGVEPVVTELVWVERLGLSLRFRVDAVSLLMTALVSGIGALLFLYAISYFDAASAGAIRFPVALLGFSASMLGLVLAESAWTLFIFWELTSITSFVLVAHKNTDAAALQAARRALMITAGGGLALLVGLLVLERAGGVANLTDLAPVDGTSATLAAVLLLVAAATKSAQVPFHVWLPGAMAAPTPVSAYLHSATMVKAGVLLMALAGPAFVQSATWEILGLAFGITSMVWGAIGALRHTDAKLILAWGTVSQLGLLVTLLALGTGKAVFAATSLFLAHALFKAALFAVVGEIDVRTGSRDIAHVAGLGRAMPATAAVAALAGLSMAGVPPLLGFPAKEAAIEAVLALDGVRLVVVGGAVIGSAMLTVAYTVRLLVGLFGSATGPGSGRSTVDLVAGRPYPLPSAPRPVMTIVAAILAGLGLVGYIVLQAVNAVVGPAAVAFNDSADAYELLRWPGFTFALTVSSIVIVAGGALGSVLAARIGRESAAVPRPLGAEAADRLLDGILVASRRVIGKVQHGSLPLYLTAMVATVVLAGIPFVSALSGTRLVAWDRPLQMALAVVIVASAVTGTTVQSRLGAALTLGSIGICVSGLFVLHGAPDLVLTQLLVETVVVVGFVIGLGHLARRFPDAPDAWQAVRIVVSLLIGGVVVVGLVAAGADPTGIAPVAELTRQAIDEGGGNNIVNVILTDIRALDTLGEIVVLAVVAVGILALANVRRMEVTS